MGSMDISNIKVICISIGMKMEAKL
jgi:hypothetical protein